jgi:AAA family ATP:ADP antiporter
MLRFAAHRAEDTPLAESQPESDTVAATAAAGGQVPLTGVKRNEWPALIIAFVYFFLVLAAYYVLRPVREQLAAASGSQVLFQFYLTTFLVTLVLTPVYGWLIARFPRKRFVPVVYLFFIACLFAFIPAFEAQGQLNPRVLGQVFFVWLSVFNLFVVAVFWSFIADIFSVEQSHRLFGIIAFGGALGAIAGPLLTKWLVHWIGIGPLLGVAACMLLGAVACILALVAWSRRHPVAQDAQRNEAIIGGGFWAGAKLVFASKFLRRVAILMLLGDCVGTVLYNLQTDIGHQYYPDGAARTDFYASIDLSVNVLMAVLQILVTRVVLTRFGPVPALTGTEIVKALTLITLALLGQPAAVAAAMIVTRGGAYGVEKPATDSLYTRVDRETRYKAKGFVDTAVWRFGDVAVVGIITILRDFGMTTSGFASLSAVAAMCAAFIAWRLKSTPELAHDKA